MHIIIKTSVARGEAAGSLEIKIEMSLAFEER